MNGLLRDLRFARRTLAKNPGYTAVAVVVLALGIGANTAVFSLVKELLLESPLPLTEPERLVKVYDATPKAGFPWNNPAPANFFEQKRENRVFEDMAAGSNANVSLTGDGTPESVRAYAGTINTFHVLGVAPLLGRDFLQEEEGPGKDRVAALGYGLWQRRYGGDPDIVGREILIDGSAHTVVGVMPGGFWYPWRDVELWTPVGWTEEQKANRRAHYLQVVARLKPGFTTEEAQANLSAIAARLESEYPDSNRDVGVVLEPLRDTFVGETRPALLALLGAAALVLLLACANVANLLLVRGAHRKPEMALRAALGASRKRVVRQLLTESLLMAALGGGLGILMASWASRLLLTLVPPSLEGVVELSIDLPVLGCALAAAMVSLVLAGLAPAMDATRVDLAAALHSSGSRSVAGGGRLRHGLVVSQVALAVLLLAGAGLMLRTLQSLLSQPLGYRSEGILTVRTVLPAPKYAEFQPRAAFYRDVLERVRALPGVRSAGYSTFLPFGNVGGTVPLQVENRSPEEMEQMPQINFRQITPGYMETLGFELLRGRLIGESDHDEAAAVAVVNRLAAGTLFSGDDPLGKRFRLRSEGTPWIQVVGVVENTHQAGIEQPPRPELYVCGFQKTGVSWFAPRALAVRTTQDPVTLVPAVRQAVWAVDADQPVSNVQTMAAIVDDQLAGRRTQAVLLGSFALLALLLASLGIYGVLAFAVSRQLREIGIRMALGAQRSAVVGGVLRRGLGMAGIGVAIGLAAALALSPLAASVVYGVAPTDPLALGGGTLVLIGVAVLASYLPARRAAKVDPAVALRHE